VDPELLNADGKNISLENFQAPCQNSNPEPPTFWRSVSVNCGSARPIPFHSYGRHGMKGRWLKILALSTVLMLYEQPVSLVHYIRRYPQFRGTVSFAHNSGTQNAVVTGNRRGLTQRHHKSNYVLSFQSLYVLAKTEVSNQRHFACKTKYNNFWKKAGSKSL